MRTVMLFLKLATILLLILSPVGFSMDKEVDQDLFYEGIKLYAKLGDGTILEASIFLEPYEKLKSKRVSKFWGFDREEPSWLIRELSLKIRGSKAMIPKKAIADLADITLPGDFYMTETKGTIFLHISGGDGAGGYSVTFRFEGNRLVSRRIEFINREGNRDSLTQNMEDKWNPGRP